MLKVSLIFVVVLRALTIINAGSNGNESHPITDRQAINSTHEAKHYKQHQPSKIMSHSHEPMSFVKSDLLYLSELPLEQLLKVKKSIDEIQQVSRHAAESNSKHDNHQSNQIINDIGVVVEEMKPSTTIQSRTIGDEGGKGYFSFPGGKLLQSLIGGKSQQPPQAINRKTGYGGGAVEAPWEQGKQSKIQTFFQLSITALAFLAFAGYLLCMIVQAIKAKGTTLLMANNLQNASTANSLISAGSVPLRRRRRPITITGRRKRNAILLSSDNRNDTISSIYAEAADMNNPHDSEMYRAMIAIAEGYVKVHYF